jgi:hypothetical protein
MDVLELPRPVINFLRTMAKEGCRYTLSWDIFGGPDRVTLTLTWKLLDNQLKSSIMHESLSTARTNDEQVLQQVDPNSLQERSSRDDSTLTTAVFRSSKDETNSTIEPSSTSRLPPRTSVQRSSIESSAQSACEPTVSVAHCQRPSLNTLPLADDLSSSLERTQQDKSMVSTARRSLSRTATTNRSSIIRKSPVAVVNDIDIDNDEQIDPWIKRFDCSLKKKHDERTDRSNIDSDRSEVNLGKVKFKAKPDYF